MSEPATQQPGRGRSRRSRRGGASSSSAEHGERGRGMGRPAEGTRGRGRDGDGTRGRGRDGDGTRGRGRDGDGTRGRGRGRGRQSDSSAAPAPHSRLYPLIDIGINLTKPSFEPELGGLLARSEQVGCAGLVITGTSMKASKQAVRLVQRIRESSSGSTAAASSSTASSSASGVQVWCTAGVHPHDASTWSAMSLADLEKLCRSPHCVAVGECGLDFNRMFSPQAQQEACFAAQIALAVKLRKPLFLHERDAHERFLAILKRDLPSERDGGPPAVVHCFTGTREHLRAYLDAGFYIGITGWVTDPVRGKTLLELIPDIPLDRLMVETDAPFLTPFNMPDQPRNNEPAFLPYVVDCIAAAYKRSPQEIAEITTRNAQRFFSLGHPFIE